MYMYCIYMPLIMHWFSQGVVGVYRNAYTHTMTACTCILLLTENCKLVSTAILHAVLSMEYVARKDCLEHKINNTLSCRLTNQEPLYKNTMTVLRHYNVRTLYTQCRIDWLPGIVNSYRPTSLHQTTRWCLLAVIPVLVHVIRGLCKVYIPAATDNTPSLANWYTLAGTKESHTHTHAHIGFVLGRWTIIALKKGGKYQQK